ncbi:izumo sperm-egg fusion protein 3 isoform X1 [Phyllobates terribilis]|uniref:izumo sperm-egg fusion protein 3 isoform X1 n=1 Tax=Phyllobates terribilis TaxID=111132 RepID=UPI003CCA7CDD
MLPLRSPPPTLQLHQSSAVGPQEEERLPHREDGRTCIMYRKAVIEGPVLDSKTCLRIRAQCFKGSVCGEPNDLEVEKKEVALFLSLILEIVIMFAIMILCYHYYKMKTTQLKEKLLKLIWSKKEQDIEDGSRNI